MLNYVIRNILPFFAILFLASCMSGQIDKIQTPSGNPEATFKGETRSEVSGKIVGACASRGRTVEVASDTQVICRDTVLNIAGTGAHVAYKLSMGNSYSSDPEAVYTYNIVKVNGDTKVYVSRYVELNMAFGQNKRENGFGSAKDHNRIVELLQSIGGKV